ncbi:MAG: hypothetical protein ACFFCW_29460, partial [Candidatus Hodarchaeota archaeon]
RWHWTPFYKHEPENYEEPERLVDAFRGIKFSVVWLDDVGLHLAADVRHKYIGKYSLADYINSNNRSTIADHLRTGSRSKDETRSCFVRDNKVVRYSCLYAGETGQPVKDATFLWGAREVSVLQYYKEKFKIDLPQEDMAVFVKDKEYKEAIQVPSCRLFPAFDTDQIKRMHQGLRIQPPPSPQLLPQRRMEMILELLEHLREVRFGDESLKLRLEPISEIHRYFIPPNLEFGGGYVLRYGEISDPMHADNRERLVADWIRAKMPSLLRHGVFSSPGLPRFYLWMPSVWPRGQREDVKEFLVEELKLQTKAEYLTFVPRTYEKPSQLLDGLKEIRHHALGIVGLPASIPQGTYSRVKQIDNIKTQCFTERTASRITEASFRRNLVLAALIEAGVKPWVLETDLNYDVYVGIDVLENRAAFHFFWGRGARNMRFLPGHSVSQARRQEAIKARHTSRYLEQGLEDIYRKTSEPIKSLTIHRDGRWWPSEQDGLEATTTKMKRSGVIARDFKVAVVEIRKTHLPVRLLVKKFDKGVSFFANPIPGVYRILNRNQMLMVCTWNPVRPDAENGRTSGVVLLNVAYSFPSHDILEIGKEVYDLTQLNWTAPGIEINVPVTIRWADHRLQEELLKKAEAEEDDLEIEEEDWVGDED